MGTEDLYHKNKIRKAKDLQRRVAVKDPYETVLIICEDTKSVPYYFKECIRLFRLNSANVKVIPGKGSAPISIIEQAMQIGEETSGIDHIFCVFDQDNHESFDRAIDRIRLHNEQNDLKKPKYTLVKSIPCFEIWLLLHFVYSTKQYEMKPQKSAAEQVCHEVKKYIPKYSKNDVTWFNEIKNRMDIAIKHAKQLELYHGKNRSPNPSTNMHEIIEYLMRLK